MAFVVAVATIDTLLVAFVKLIVIAAFDIGVPSEKFAKPLTVTSVEWLKFKLAWLEKLNEMLPFDPEILRVVEFVPKYNDLFAVTVKAIWLVE